VLMLLGSCCSWLCPTSSTLRPDRPPRLDGSSLSLRQNMQIMSEGFRVRLLGQRLGWPHSRR
jgi:hypothetical protein